MVIQDWEDRLRAAARELQYPPTPDIAGSLRQRMAEAPKGAAPRWRAALITAACVLILLAGLLSVPSVRAAVLEFLQIGSIRIPLPAASPTATPMLPSTASESAPLPSQTPLPGATPADLVDMDELAGETTLDRAIQIVSFPFKLPTYPQDIGQPDRVFLQDMDGDVLILVWVEDDQPDRPMLVLYQIAPGSWAGEKGEPTILERTRVNGQEAVWAEGPHVFRLTDGNRDFRRLITGHALIWAENGVTYRLESYLDMAEAIHIAESLEFIP